MSQAPAELQVAQVGPQSAQVPLLLKVPLGQAATQVELCRKVPLAHESHCFGFWWLEHVAHADPHATHVFKKGS